MAESRGGRWIHNADNNRLTHSPTTSPYGDSSFPKEENGDTTDYKLSSHYFTNSPYNQIFCLFLCLFLLFQDKRKKVVTQM
ncbi:hypothetical protein C5Z00_04845 [Bacteroides caccae]|nr:hypothetical protein C5Z00_04845 [Bacteroides caccae]